MKDNEKKYKLIPAQGNQGNDFVRPRFQIQALREFKTHILEYDENGNIAIKKYTVQEGEMGGFISSDDNLSHNGTCWIFPDAEVLGSCSIIQNATVQRSKLHNNVKVCCNAHISDVSAYGSVQIGENAVIYNENESKQRAEITDKAIITGNTFIHNFNNLKINGLTLITGKVEIQGNDIAILNKTKIMGNNIKVLDNCLLTEETFINGTVRVSNIESSGKVTIKSKEILRNVKEPGEVQKVIGEDLIKIKGTVSILGANIYGSGTIDGTERKVTLRKDLELSGVYTSPIPEPQAQPTQVFKQEKLPIDTSENPFKSSHGINDTWIDHKEETIYGNYPDGDSDYSFTLNQ
jgi:hypothetical protein